MTEAKDKTRREYSIVAEFANGTKKYLNINLVMDDAKPAYDLPYIDHVLHHIPNSIFMMKLVCNVNGLDYNSSQLTAVYIINNRYPDKKKNILYSNLPLPLNVPDAYAYLNHHRILEMFDHNASYNEVAKKKQELFTYLTIENANDLEFANRKFIEEVVKSYRLRRELTLTLFKEEIYHYQPPEDLLPPALDDPNQMRMF